MGNDANIILGCSLEEHYRRTMLTMLFKVVISREPNNFFDRLKFTRSTWPLNLHLPRRARAGLDGMFVVQGPKMWNLLPAVMRRIQNSGYACTIKRSAQKLTRNNVDIMQSLQ